MKNLNITFEDSEFKRLEVLKERSGLSWEKFIIKRILGESVWNQSGSLRKDWIRK